MNNVYPPSRFTTRILLHRCTQKRLQSSAEKASGYRYQDLLWRVSLAEDRCLVKARLW
jgi:hypothetical protein